MTETETRRLLEGFVNGKHEAKALSERILALRSAAEKTTSAVSPLPRSGSTGRKDDIYAEIIELEQEYSARIKELHAREQLVFACVKRVENGMLRTLLFERYINGKTWEAVAEAIGYQSEYWVRTALHRNALAAAAKETETG